METTENGVDVRALAMEKVRLGEGLLDKLKTFQHINGVQKVEKKISQEIKFFQKAISREQLKLNHILGSNLAHYNYLVTILSQTTDVQSLEYAVKVDGNLKSTNRVDIVADKGCTWIKVIARNPKALSDVVDGQASYGTKSILDHAENYIRAANENPCNFRTPNIIFDFSNDLTKDLSEALTDMGIDVRINGYSNKKVVDNLANNKLNLDITTLLAYVSGQTNGSAHWEFKDPLLTQQAARERESPVKQFLETTFQNKHLIVCETAVKSLLDIISVLGGPNEKIRAEEFIKTISVLPDLSPAEESQVPGHSRLKISGQIKERSLKVFLFGIFHKAITVSSNEGFLRAAKMQGVDIPSIVHDARALTEQKEDGAKPIFDT